jgi:heme A synthase
LPSSSRRKTRSSGASRRRSRQTGCLLWVLGLIIILTILALLFGGFQKGTKAGMAADAGIAASLSRPQSAPSLTVGQPVRHVR